MKLFIVFVVLAVYVVAVPLGPVKKNHNKSTENDVVGPVKKNHARNVAGTKPGKPTGHVEDFPMKRNVAGKPFISF